MRYIIWYDSINGKYNWGSEKAYKFAFEQSSENAILAEEFTNTSEKLIEKITAKLNNNLTLVK